MATDDPGKPARSFSNPTSSPATTKPVGAAPTSSLKNRFKPGPHPLNAPRVPEFAYLRCASIPGSDVPCDNRYVEINNNEQYAPGLKLGRADGPAPQARSVLRLIPATQGADSGVLVSEMHRGAEIRVRSTRGDDGQARPLLPHPKRPDDDVPGRVFHIQVTATDGVYTLTDDEGRAISIDDGGYMVSLAPETGEPARFTISDAGWKPTLVVHVNRLPLPTDTRVEVRLTSGNLGELPPLRARANPERGNTVFTTDPLVVNFDGSDPDNEDATISLTEVRFNYRQEDGTEARHVFPVNDRQLKFDRDHSGVFVHAPYLRTGAVTPQRLASALPSCARIVDDMKLEVKWQDIAGYRLHVNNTRMCRTDCPIGVFRLSIAGQIENAAAADRGFDAVPAQFNNFTSPTDDSGMEYCAHNDGGFLGPHVVDIAQANDNTPVYYVVHYLAPEYRAEDIAMDSPHWREVARGPFPERR
ncbi:MAG: hypothetical protein ACPGU7_09740 [Gammaproteobacteria bacterium]